MADQLKLSNQLCFPIYTVAKEVINLYRPILKDLDLTYPQYLVMLVLWENQELNVSQIGSRLNLDTGTLTPLLKRLVQKELIVKNRKSGDERIVSITLTEKGNALQQKASGIPLQLAASLNISQEDLKELKRILNQITEQIK